MKKQIIISAVAIVILTLGFSGCFGNDSNDELNKFIGTWNHGTIPASRPLIFTSDGNCDYMGDQAIWELKNEKLVVNLTDHNIELIFDYEFLDDNKLLILTNTETEQTDDYIKQ
ncbi:MAG: hypothetical protein JSU91_05940 [Thermoplasmatales archaeon]|nr:MAG: hypothetical protein JSU91_05940 [Thermoplasmatales archaeon]